MWIAPRSTIVSESRSKLLRNRWVWRLYALLRSSIVARTTLAILVPSMLLGLTFASVASWTVDRREQQRAEIRLQQLLSTVERTAQIACYLNDRTLAAEIAQGLMRNREVSGVRITSGDTTLSQTGDTRPVHQGGIHSSQITTRIYSPFDDRESVGQLSLFVDRPAIHTEAVSYSHAATFAMVLQVALVAAGVAIAVYFFSTRPIRAVSKELHRIRFDTGLRLHVPASNRFDEIGSLVTDVNSLLASLADLLTTEREQRIAREVGERKMRMIFEKSETGIFVLDDRGSLESWNPAFIRLLHLTPEQLPQSGATQLQRLLAPHAARLEELIHRSLMTGVSDDLDLEIAGGGSRAAWIQIALNPVGPTALQGIVNDITERKQSELSAHALATQDTLTGLLNRRGLETGLGAAFSLRSLESAGALALLLIDLDLFKEVNDTHGHEGGDQVLRHVAQVLQRNTRRGDLIARPGGDEFVVALVGIGEPPKAEEIANTIIDEISRPIEIGGGHYAHVGASIGIAFASGPTDSPDALLRRADAAMYSAKKGGRGQVRLAPVSAQPQTSAVA
jgi:diguanylate cyclase (GGDEF)-like protein/PAS domain S-box-containing protein